jgi:hypothetical protein
MMEIILKIGKRRQGGNRSKHEIRKFSLLPILLILFLPIGLKIILYRGGSILVGSEARERTTSAIAIVSLVNVSRRPFYASNQQPGFLAVDVNHAIFRVSRERCAL